MQVFERAAVKKIRLSNKLEMERSLETTLSPFC